MTHSLQWLRRKRTGAVPVEPAQPEFSNVTGNGVTLSWARVSGVTFFTLQRATNPAGPFTDLYSGNDLTAFDDTGLSNSTLYYYRLIASNRFGDSEPSENTVVTLDTPTPPATPDPPTVTAFATTTISLAWTAVATATAYTLQRSTSSGSGFATVYSGPNLSFTDSGLTGATPYYYRLSASNADGTSAYSTVMSQTTAGNPTPPNTPAQPTATNVTASSAFVSWVNPGGATDYDLQRRQTAPGSATSFVTIYSGQNTSFQDTLLASAATYEYKVRASNSAGTSAYSTVRIITTGNVTGTNVQPVSALLMRQNAGVATHPNFNTGVFKPANAPEYVDLIGDAGFGFIRGNFSNEDVFVPLLRARGIKWICGVATEGSTHPTNDTETEIRAKLKRLRNYPDVIGGIEGINEPNHNRGTGDIVDTWATETVDVQKMIWQETQWNLTSVGGNIGSGPNAGSVQNPLKDVKIYGPSLHDIACENSYKGGSPSGGPRHWHQLLDLGILNYQDAAGFHCYPGGGIPLRGARNLVLINEGNLGNGEGGNATGRLELMWSAYGTGYPSYTTEWGYHNAVAQSGGHIGIDERGSGIYAPRGFIQMFTTPFRTNGTGLTNNTACTWFEALDDFDDGAKNSQEANFGLIGYTGSTAAAAENPANWRTKPQYDSMKVFLSHFMPESLDDDAYIPNRVRCDVATSASPDYLEWQVFATKAQSDAGTATVAIYRRLRCWDRSSKTIVNVPSIQVTITDRVGARNFQVGAPVLLVDLR